VNGTFHNDETRDGPLRPLPGLRTQPPVRPSVDADIARFAIVQLGLAPDKKQLQILRSTAKRGILNCSRQWGKSTVAAVKALHRASTRAGSLVLVASPSERQSAEFLRKVAPMVRKLGIRVRGDGDNPISILLPNQSRIVGLPGVEATARGFSAVSLMLIDEAARVPDDVYQGLRPMLGVGDGDLWMMSTPWGQRGFFYETWTNAGPEWCRVSVKATECPRISKTFLEEERKEKTSDWFAQEYLCEFTTNEEMLFEREMVEAAFDDTLGELDFGRR